MSSSALSAATKPWKSNSPKKPRPPASPALPATAPSAACASRSITPSRSKPSKPSPASCANSTAPAADFLRANVSTGRTRRRIRFGPLSLGPRRKKRYLLSPNHRGSHSYDDHEEDGSPAAHQGPADSSRPGPRTAVRLGPLAPHPPGLRQDTPDSTGFPVPFFAPAREPRLDQREMGHDEKQTPREI